MSEPKPTLAYTPDEVAQRLHIGRTKIFSTLKSGELRSFVVGRSRRISDTALSEFIANSELQSTKGDAQ
jgi:excisionase family DNA binding protein